VCWPHSQAAIVKGPNASLEGTSQEKRLRSEYGKTRKNGTQSLDHGEGGSCGGRPWKRVDGSSSLRQESRGPGTRK
jgi:hypothetical protein